jgi:P pilus assembly chaperone PapD
MELEMVNIRSPRARKAIASFLVTAAALSSSVANAGVGDLLVAPTRVVLDSSRGTEVVLNNIGTDTANYRISLELRRMKPDGDLEEVAIEQGNDHEKKTLEIISYAPRRVTLPPNQPQAIRVGVRAGDELPDGEYRAHMVFRAIPDAVPAAAAGNDKGLSIKLIPIYGVVIPIIIRRGNLQVTAKISEAHLETKSASSLLDFTLQRTGTRSVYGNIRIVRAGIAKPLFEAKGIAVYAEIAQRTVALPLTTEQAAALRGPVTVEYREPDDLGGGLITSLQTELR